jgi:hypothetical protein
MNNDPIVEEIRRIRHAHAERFNNDVDAIFEDYRLSAAESGRQYVSYPPRRPEPTTAAAAPKQERKPRAKAAKIKK